MKAPETIGVINPYALTEVLTGRKINWRDERSHRLMEEVLETDYDELFDPKYNSPLYAGLELSGDNELKIITEDKLEIRDDSEIIDTSIVNKVSDLSNLGINDINNLRVKSSRLARGNIEMRIKVPEIDKSLTNKRISKLLKEISLPYAKGSTNTEWTPSNASWVDKGDFFEDTTEYDDPIQGAVANCYFIAALAAVAWAQPYLISHRVRAIGTGDSDRTNMIKFYSKGGGKDESTKEIEVTDTVPVSSSSGNYMYCRSNDANEIWPAVYEKAFAKWITKNNTDKPDITKTAFGNCVKATAQINNKKPHYWSTKDLSSAECYSLVRAHSRSYKTIHPMTAWTYGSDKDYTGSNIVGNHAYTILGWAYKNNTKYIVLRNPWGVTEPTGYGSYQGVVQAFDESFWRSINLVGNDGVFALRANYFDYYFKGFGVAK